MRDFFEDRPRPNLLRRIWLWWNNDAKYYHKHVKWGIQNLIYWFPIIWKDRNWDGHFIYEVLKHKLKTQAKYIGRRDYHTRAQQDARNMKICVNLIQKIQDDFYQLEYSDYTKDRTWFEPCNDGTDNFTWESENVWEKYDDFFKKYPLIYKKVLNGQGPFTLDGRDESDMKRIIAMNICHLNQQRAQDLLFKIINENINSWWS